MKKFISKMFDSLPKRLATGALLALAVALPMAASAADAVQITAVSEVANVTNGDTTWSQSTSATNNQVIAVQVSYMNEEAAGSGETANNLGVKINIPSTPGANQTITTTTAGDNTNTVNGSVNVTLGQANAYLQYIPGTATWTHAVSATSSQTTTQNVSDNVVLSPTGLVLENENPCQGGAISIQARVMVPGVSITKQVEGSTQSNAWATSNTANPGDTLKYMITFKNTGNTTENDVMISDALPKGLTFVPNSTMIMNSTFPNGSAVAGSAVTGAGIDIGNYAPNAVGYVELEAQVPAAAQLTCGENEFRNVGYAQPSGMSQYNAFATTDVTDTCPTTPTFTCNLLTVNTTGDRQISASVQFTAQNGATFKSAVFNFGDNSTPLTTSNSTANYTYANYGTYTVTASVLFSVNGQNQTVTSANCSKSITFTAPGTTPATPVSTVTPTQLPNTGAGNVIGLFAVTTILGAIAHRLFWARRLARQS
jgi:uncharacterized repeat protein (TIGR01451 family)